MTDNDREFFAWGKTLFGDGPMPKDWKTMYAEHLLKTKSKTQIWKMLCGPAGKNQYCHCNCLCAPGIAWNKLLDAANLKKKGSDEKEAAQ